MDKAPISARQAALNRLTAREYTSIELLRYLFKKGYEEEEILSTLQELQKQKLLNDQRYIELFTRAQAMKGKGPAVISQKLREKGVRASRQEIAKIYGEAAPESEDEQIKKIIAKRYPRYQSEAKSYRRALGALLRRGFSQEKVSRALGRPPRNKKED